LTIDGRPQPKALVFKPDSRFNRFTHVGVMIPADDIFLDYIRVEGE